MSLTKNVVAIRKGMVLVPDASAPKNQSAAAALQAELMQLGYMLDVEAFGQVAYAPTDWLRTYYEEVVGYLKKALGADRSYQPFYRNFPTQVMEMNRLDLFLNAVYHYWSNGTWEPSQALKDRGIHFENTDFRMIHLGTETSLKEIFTQMVSINQSLTESDKETVAWFIDVYGAENLVLPAAIPFKETLCILAAKKMKVPVRNATDVLRVAVYLSGGDISLPKTSPPVFRKFVRSERRFLMDLFAATDLNVAEMKRHEGSWLRLGEKLHPGELVKKYPAAVEAFRQLREQPNGDPSEFSKMPRFAVRTFNGEVDLAFQESFRSGVNLLKTRPGELARRLDWLLRHSIDEDYVLGCFRSVGNRVSGKVLFEMYTHFQNRLKAGVPRVIRLKSKRAKIKTLPALDPLPAEIVASVQRTIMFILSEKIAAKPKLGRVWLDERLRDIPLPFSMRSINSGIRTYVRGTRIPFRADAKVIRPFIHWHDEYGSIDLDLSVGFYSEEFKSKGHISFTNLRLSGPLKGVCHSGDIRHRVGACAEYVDIPVQELLDAGVRYAIVHVFNYNGESLHSVKDCVFGLMEREVAVAGEIFVPKTISNCMGMANEGNSLIICVIDLLKRNYIWADTECDRGLAVLEETRGPAGEILRSLILNDKMTVYDLLKIHAESRGTLVASKDDPADLRISFDDMATDYTKVGEFMNV